jgi:hypothetical protein
MMMKYIWILLFLAGCGTTNIVQLQEEYAINPTPALAEEIAALEARLEAKEYNEQIDRENWALCETAYRQAGLPTWHQDHTHTRGATRDSIEYVKRDLHTNRCRQILKPAGLWADKL